MKSCVHHWYELTFSTLFYHPDLYFFFVTFSIRTHIKSLSSKNMVPASLPHWISRFGWRTYWRTWNWWVKLLSYWGTSDPSEIASYHRFWSYKTMKTQWRTGYYLFWNAKIKIAVRIYYSRTSKQIHYHSVHMLLFCILRKFSTDWCSAVF